MSIFKDNLLAKNASFITSADALLRSSVQQERFRALQAIEALDRVRSNIQDGAPLNRIFGNIGQLSNIIAATLGFGSKAVGPISELPLEQRVRVNDWRFTKTKSEHRRERNAALRRTPESGGFSIFGVDADAISLLPGQISQGRDQLINKFGPVDAGMVPYSLGAGREAAAAYIGRVFPFEITNYALVGNASAQYSTANTDSEGQPADLSKMRFPAYIRGINEQLNATWSSKSYIGRAEDLYMYNGASRSLNIDVTLFATNNDLPSISRVVQSPTSPVVTFDNGYEIPVSKLISDASLVPANEAVALMNNSIDKTTLWKMINFLMALCYPAYDNDNRWARTPFARLTLGSLYEQQLIIVNSLNISYDPLVWDMNGQHFTPMFVNVTLAITMIHESSPGTLADGSFGFTDDTGNIRFLHRSDFQQ